MTKKRQTFEDMQKLLTATITNLRKTRRELENLEKKGRLGYSLSTKLELAERNIVDSTLLLMEEKEGTSEQLEKVNGIVNDARLEAWRTIARIKTGEVKAELFSLWYSDRELEKEFNNARSIIDNANSEAEKGAIEEAIRNYDHGIDKLSSVYMELTRIKQRSSVKNMAKFLVWGVPLVFAIAQFLAFNKVEIVGYEIPWYGPLIALVAGCFVVWGWIRSRRGTKENILITILGIVVWVGIVVGLVLLVQFLSGYFTVDATMTAVIIIVIYSTVSLVMGLSTGVLQRIRRMNKQET